jgi:hypothetical protein
MDVDVVTNASDFVGILFGIPLTGAQTAIGSSRFAVLNVCRESYASYPFRECLDRGNPDRAYRKYSKPGRR